MRVALLLIGLLVACVDPDAPMDPSDTAEFEIEVPKGSTASGIGKMLTDQGLVPGELQWKLFLREADGGCLKAGRFKVSRALSMRQLLERLCGPPLANDVPFTVVEGWRIREIDAALAEKGWIRPGEYAALATSKQVDLPFEVPSPTLEGYLYPETYLVAPDRFTAKAFIERQLQTFEDVFLSKREADVQARGLHAIVVMASLLEREEPDPSLRPTVAGILWKRLDHGWALGVDATSRYELPEWNDRQAFLKKLRDPNDPYNTRLNKGLPPTAIGNPAIESLEAALAPVASEYWYYLHDPQRKFHGGRDAAEHEANRARYGVY